MSSSSSYYSSSLESSDYTTTSVDEDDYSSSSPFSTTSSSSSSSEEYEPIKKKKNKTVTTVQKRHRRSSSESRRRKRVEDPKSTLTPRAKVTQTKPSRSPQIATKTLPQKKRAPKKRAPRNNGREKPRLSRSKNVEETKPKTSEQTKETTVEEPKPKFSREKVKQTKENEEQKAKEVEDKKDKKDKKAKKKKKKRKKPKGTKLGALAFWQTDTSVSDASTDKVEQHTARKMEKDNKKKKSKTSNPRHSRMCELVEVGTAHTTTPHFTSMYTIQTVSIHKGAVWVIAFRPDGALMASGGSDGILRVWTVQPDTSSTDGNLQMNKYLDTDKVVSLIGHTEDILSISWAHNGFIISASMDTTVRLWHPDRTKSVSTFSHSDFVACAAFHPLNNKVFLTGGLDRKVCVWNLPRDKVVYMEKLQESITAASFTGHHGKYLLAGTDVGKIYLFETETKKAKESGKPGHLKLVKGITNNDSKFAKRKKISGVICSNDGKYLLVSSNDCTIRMYSTKSFNLICSYTAEGYMNREFQINASFSHDRKYIISGSETSTCFIWETEYHKERKTDFESFTPHKEMATVAIFAPPISTVDGYVIVTADVEGNITVFHNIAHKNKT